MRFELKVNDWQELNSDDLRINEVRNVRTEPITPPDPSWILTELPARTGVPHFIADFYTAGENHRVEDGKLVRDFVSYRYYVEIEVIQDLLDLYHHLDRELCISPGLIRVY